MAYCRKSMTISRYDTDSRLATTLCDNRQPSAHASDIRLRHTTYCRTGFNRKYRNAVFVIKSERREIRSKNIDHVVQNGIYKKRFRKGGKW